MSLSSYLLRKFISNPREAMRIKQAGDEIREYAIWRIYAQLESENILRSLQEQAWWSFKDSTLAKLICDLLVEEDLARWKGDAIEVTGSPRKPAITTREAADMVPVIDRAAETLPRALLLGEKPSRDQVKAASAKLLDNFAVRLEYEVAVEETGLDKLDPDSVIADIYPRVGASTLILLERTKARVAVIEPYSDNTEVIRRLVKLHGQESRVSFITSAPEEIKMAEKVDAAFMGQVIHWTLNPRLALSRVRELLKEEGFLVISQTVYSSVGLVTGLVGVLLGAMQPPPTSSELRRMIINAGFKVDKWLESMGVVVAKASPVQSS